MRYIGFAVIGLVAILALTWAVQGNSFFLYKTFAPKQEQVRREVFEQSKAYRQGMIQELENMHAQYVTASPEHQAALASIILHRAADVDESIMPANLKAFIDTLKAEQYKAR